MCLACEMDALWFAEVEARATPFATAGFPPAFSDESGNTGITPDPSDEAGAPSDEAGGMPAVPTSRFLCEETRSE